MKNNMLFWHTTVFITQIDSILLDSADSSFSDNYKQTLQKTSSHYTQSLSARYLIAQYFLKKTGRRFEIPLGEYSVPLWEHSEKNIFFSYSFIHSSSWSIYVVWCFAASKIGIDAEFVKERDVSLLQKYKVAHREDFYTLRTAKEAIVKYKNLSANDIEHINIKNFPFVTKKMVIDDQSLIISLMV